MINRIVFFSLLCTMLSWQGVSQNSDGVHWLTFEQLEDSLSVKPKKVYIDFYADWCVYCKKMDRTAYRDQDIIRTLNSEYYTVKMNAETPDTIVFGGETYVNKEVGKKRNPTHEIALLLASRENQPFSLPAIIVLDERFEVNSRFFEYLSPSRLKMILKEN